MNPDIVLAVYRDEEDVIEAFVRFHLAMGFDAIYLVNNLSSDRSESIVQALIEEGLPIIQRRDARIGYDKNLTDHYIWAGLDAKARWLFFLDCDEFVYFPDGVKSFVSSLPLDVNLLRLPQRQMHQPSSGPAQGKFGFLLTSISSITLDEDPSKVASRFALPAKVWGGKHRIDVPKPREVLCPTVIIRHYKYRTEYQTMRKEHNRVSSEGSFTSNDLKALSSFDVESTREWISECKDRAGRGDWTALLTPNKDVMTDDVLSRWAGRMLLRTVITHSVPEERLLLHEVAERALHSAPIFLQRGSCELVERLSGLGVLKRMVAPRTGGVAIAERLSAPDLFHCVDSARWVLVDSRNVSVREVGLYALERGYVVTLLDEQHYGELFYRRASIPRGSSLVSLTIQRRAENGLLASYSH